MSKTALDEMIEGVENSQSFEKTSWLELYDEGKYRLQVLPLKGGVSNRYPSYRIFIHSQWKDPNRNKNSLFKCLGKECPLCIKANKERAAGDRNAWKRQARVSFLYYVLDANGNLKVLKAPAKLNEAIESEWLAKAKNEKINIFDSNENYSIEVTRKNLKVTRNGENATETRWSVKVALEPQKISQEVLEKLERSKALGELYTSFTKEQLQMVAEGKAWVKKGNQPTSNVVSLSKEKRSEPKPAVEQKKAEAVVEEVKTVTEVLPPKVFEDIPLDEPESSMETTDEELAAMKNKIFGRRKTN